ncbi:MAG: polysaccharide deacetylase family protein [Bacteroidales bacterium]|nr:polysaccharide deacetylase family protein [Bacteroidales bacterium]
MRSICFYFQIHQPMRLRTYRFFDIGANHNYYDDYQNRFILRRIADKSYLQMNKLLLDLIKEYGPAFKVSFSISGVALDQIRMYAPDVLQSFQKLAATGNVEFLAETYYHSLSSLKSREEFEDQVNKHRELIKQTFGLEPTTFRNTELIYSDEIGGIVADMGFKTMLTEGAKHILGWKSPNYMYCNAINPKLKVLLRNYQLSDDIAFRFSERGWSEWPLTTDKFVDWLNIFDPKHEVVNLFMDYETFGEHQWRETGIFDFMRALPARVFSHSDFSFSTPAEVSDKLQPVSAIHVEDPISWADEERDITAWLGNDLQDDAYGNLYELEPMVRNSDDPEILKDWGYLQTSDHFYYMCTKWFSDGDVHKYFNPYSSPYDAYINYMNVISDLRLRLEQNAKPGEYPALRAIGKEIREVLVSQKENLPEVAGKVKAKVKKAAKKAAKPTSSLPKSGKK